MKKKLRLLKLCSSFVLKLNLSKYIYGVLNIIDFKWMVSFLGVLFGVVYLCMILIGLVLEFSCLEFSIVMWLVLLFVNVFERNIWEFLWKYWINFICLLFKFCFRKIFKCFF